MKLNERIVKSLAILLNVNPSSRRSATGFSAASQTRLASAWNPVNLTMDAILRTQLSKLRSRSRDLSINNPYIKKFAGMVVTNVLGPTGINFQSKVRFKNNEFDEKTNTLIETAWSEWGKKKNSPDVTGKFSWIGIQKQALRSVVVDGEIFIRKVRGFNNPHRFALQLIEADHLDEQYNAELPNGNRIIMGVEINPWGRPVAYHLWKKHPYDYAYATADYGLRERVPAEEIIHLFIPIRVSQRRGIPWAYAAMLKTNIADGYEEAELVAARICAAKMGVIETPDGLFSGDGEEDGKTIIEAEPGTFPKLSPGQKMSMFDPTHPSDVYPSFIKQVIRSMSAALEVSYNSISSDLESVNFSSIRSGTLEERDVWKSFQNWIIEELCDEVQPEWLRMEILTGVLPLPLADISRYNQPKWTARSWAWVDPFKDGKANTEALSAGLATRSDIYAEQGKDFYEQMDILAQEEAYLKKKGLKFNFGKTSTPSDEPSSTNDNNNADDNQPQKKTATVISMGRTGG